MALATSLRQKLLDKFRNIARQKGPGSRFPEYAPTSICHHFVTGTEPKLLIVVQCAATSWHAKRFCTVVQFCLSCCLIIPQRIEAVGLGFNDTCNNEQVTRA